MPFTSPTFLFLFLPVFLVAYWALPSLVLRNWLLMGAGIAFYAWGQGAWVAVLVGAVLATWLLGLWLDGCAGPKRCRWRLPLAAAAMLLPLLIVKYAGFASLNANAMLRFAGLPTLPVPSWAPPAGISFFTFMALTYLVAVSRGETAARRGPLVPGLYVSLLPVILAGPIVRYRDVEPQVGLRALSGRDVASGARRFVCGLAKKVLIADTLARPADAAFRLGYDDLSTGVAWFGLACYTLQIFFDFSGYSDMAIGIGRMLGFRFMENFSYPYTARSLRDFWARWHISLSTWFRDYVFLRLAYPAGRVLERASISGRRADFWAYSLATMGTMLLIGMWHGASWTFVVWGCYHGVFLALERTRLGRRVRKLPIALQHLYVLCAVMGGWALFRAGSMRHAARFAGALLGVTGGGVPIGWYAGGDVVLALAAGAVLSTRAGATIAALVEAPKGKTPSPVVQLARVLATAALLVLSLTWLSAGSYRPFIYFRF